ncbi:DNA helicase-2 / ATP-dependent DNA helicase PcrA [Sulfobacillus thermosulfidooxidans DSM 9293]|uniref:ATP-dependent DNA helicase PcrA n=2 Tax=Sulfobacillus thermosulfidooxidans TaxID=28034 RepID=A0A1W1WGX4_SULTA|nr:UvrD-helicase domain-containing protein [Sulfobacillus thermosulfidooxidans]PSR28225.1 MAG: ATP-dependent DNA helicase PcrA [Sulfobacillus thermosulfidooxidans]SMC05517.1 DNA helicase-2 / ATP-dependent DNA helicase PcrA [Sulfobacillus thermosulfidooxidans DSM 9293]
MDLLNALNERQREACEITEGPLLLLAGAGSGKTRTLTYRIAYLLDQHLAYPHQILAFTFTNKAAREMKERIERLVGDIARSMWVGTFHAVAVRILRQDIQRLGYGPQFLVYDADDAKAVIKEIIKELGWDDKQWPAAQFVHAISRAKNAFISPEHYPSQSYQDQHVQQVYQQYQKRLKSLNALDFDDLIYLTVRLFDQFPEVLEHYQDRFRYVFVDEYQDTNLAQYRLIQHLAKKHGNLCAVGDDDQAIYGWRGADMRNILEFQRDFPGARVIRLEQNYRSTQNILDAANAVVAHNQERLGKNLWTTKGEGQKIRVYEAPEEESEAWFAAEMVHEAVRRGHSLSDCAILYRTNAQSRAYEMALARAGLAYRLVGGKKFYERKEVKDVLAYLKVLFNSQDDFSLSRIINFPRRGIGDVALEKIRQYQDANQLSLYDALGQAANIPGLSAQAQKACHELHDLFESWRTYLDDSLAELTRLVAEESGIMPLFRQDRSREAQDRVENIGELLSEAKRFEEEQGIHDLGEFLGWVALVSDWDQTQEDQGGVWLMTLHSAKGLEFPVVIIGGLEEGICPHMRSIDEGTLEEERRLIYVGITRAQEELYLSYAKTRTMLGRTQQNPMSRFLGEIPENLVERPRRAAPADRAVSARNHVLTDVAVGEKVRHPRFGWGTIVAMRGEADDLELTIAFPGGGVRSFLARFAQLTREGAESV